MLESLNINDCQTVWFILLTVFTGGYLFFNGIDIGIGNIYLLTKDNEKQSLIKIMNPVWDGKELWLVASLVLLFFIFNTAYTFFYAAFFPVIILFIVVIIIRILSMLIATFIKKGALRSLSDKCMGFGSIIISFLSGSFLGNLIRGFNINGNGDYIGSFISFFNVYAIIAGCAATCLFIMLGTSRLITKTSGPLHIKAQMWFARSWAGYFLLYLILTLITYICYPWFFENLSLWIVAAFIILTMGPMLFILYGMRKKIYKTVFAASSIIFLNSFISIISGIFPRIVISFNDIEKSITIYNASQSVDLMKIMFPWAIIIFLFLTAYFVLVNKFYGKGLKE